MFVEVIVSLFIDNSDEPTFSSTVYLSYSEPRITSIVHTDCEHEQETILKSCIRTGGGILTIKGENFGADNAVVLIGSEVCNNPQHNTNHTQVVCELPGGTAAASGVIFIQSGGSMSRNQATVGYMQCNPGTYQPPSNMSICLECAPGRFTAIESQEKCLECDSTVDFQPYSGQSQCLSCPTDAVFSNNHTSCMCRSRFYAIPFGDYVLFEKLDPVGYNIYMNVFGPEANDIPSFDPNAYLDFWCVACPEGADCIADGTVIETVQSLEGWFTGVDGSGTAFFSCLNEACLAGGDCDTGYTGLGCTECDSTDYVLSDFECKKCNSLPLNLTTLVTTLSVNISFAITDIIYVSPFLSIL